MKNYTKICLAITLIILSTLGKIHAQTRSSGWQIGGNIGFAVYQGDLAPAILGSYINVDPAFSIHFSRALSASLKLRTAVCFSKIEADERKYTQSVFRQQRSLSFSSPFKEISETIVWNFLEDPYHTPRKVSPYLSAGIGVSFLNISRNSSKFNPAFFINDPQVLLGMAEDLRTKPPRTIVVFPLAVGADYYISSLISLNFDINFRFTQTDYLDGFSKVANPKNYDYYYVNSIGIVYTFNKQNKLKCPVLY